MSSPFSKRSLLKAKRYAYNKGQNHQADDFAGFVGLAYASGRKATLRQLWTDFVRGELGDSRASDGKHRWAGEPEAAEYMHATDTRPADTRHQVFLDASLSRLNLFSRIVFVLAYQYGLDDEEIADVVGATRAEIAVTRTLTVDRMRRG